MKKKVSKRRDKQSSGNNYHPINIYLSNFIDGGTGFDALRSLTA